MSTLQDITTTPLFAEAAAAARIESKRYWSQPGRKAYPVTEWRAPVEREANHA